MNLISSSGGPPNNSLEPPRDSARRLRSSPLGGPLSLWPSSPSFLSPLFSRAVGFSPPIPLPDSREPPEGLGGLPNIGIAVPRNCSTEEFPRGRGCGHGPPGKNNPFLGRMEGVCLADQTVRQINERCEGLNQVPTSCVESRPRARFLLLFRAAPCKSQAIWPRRIRLSREEGQGALART